MTEVPVYTAEQVRGAERPLLAAEQPLPEQRRQPLR